jgi:hypothetical protein
MVGDLLGRISIVSVVQDRLDWHTRAFHHKRGRHYIRRALHIREEFPVFQGSPSATKHSKNASRAQSRRQLCIDHEPH